METTFWTKKWADNEIGFHKREVNPNLMRVKSEIPWGTVFVPLCGKTLDMDWLEKQGHKVVGVELSPIACKAFFDENNRPYETSSKDDFTIFTGDNVTIWCGDFFKMESRALEGVTSIFDRAALVALPKEMRYKYVNHLIKLTENLVKVREILITFEYDQKLAEGPPHSVSESEVRSLFKTADKVELFERHEDTDLKNLPKFDGVSGFSECIYLIDMT